MLKLLVVLLCVALLSAKTNWAIVVAGSNGWWNYRHQADVSHMHTLLLKHGFDAAHIIDMQYDDLVDDPQNPQPGKLINKPNGPNVYPGHEAIDYKGDNVTPDNFLAILAGNKTAQTPKVVQSTSEDNIFIFYSDHGGPGILAFPAGGMLHANDWNNVIKDMAARHKFHEMVIYVEACEAGSMFSDILPNNIHTYTTTASNPHESSWGYYCEDPQFGTCLGDEYSIHFMEDLDQADYDHWTLQQQYIKIRDQTLKSHVCQYGDVTHITPEVVRNFVAFKKFANTPAEKNTQHSGAAVPSKDVPLVMKWRKYIHANDAAVKEAAHEEFLAEMEMRQNADVRMKMFATFLGKDVKELTAAKGRAHNVDHFKAAIKLYEMKCGQFNDYTLQDHTHALVNALNEGVSLRQIQQALAQAC